MISVIRPTILLRMPHAEMLAYKRLGARFFSNFTVLLASWLFQNDPPPILRFLFWFFVSFSLLHFSSISILNFVFFSFFTRGNWIMCEQ